MEMTVDVNTDIYPVAEFEKLNVALASTLKQFTLMTTDS